MMLSRDFLAYACEPWRKSRHCPEASLHMEDTEDVAHCNLHMSFIYGRLLICRQQDPQICCITPIRALLGNRGQIPADSACLADSQSMLLNPECKNLRCILRQASCFVRLQGRQTVSNIFVHSAQHAEISSTLNDLTLESSGLTHFYITATTLTVS